MLAGCTNRIVLLVNSAAKASPNAGMHHDSDSPLIRKVDSSVENVLEWADHGREEGRGNWPGWGSIG